MVELLRTEEFDTWLRKLKDRDGKVRILTRIERLALGHTGDARPIGEGLSELRIHAGPGYRVYFLVEGQRIVLLLCGGDKGSQRSDIARARELTVKWYESRRGE